MKKHLVPNWKHAAAVLAVAGAALVAGGLFSSGPVLGADRDTGRAALQGLSDAFARAAEESSPAVVYIEVEKEYKGRNPHSGMNQNDFFERFFGPGQPMQPRGRTPRPEVPEGNDQNWRVPVGQGSGFVITGDGYIVTNHHVVGDADKINVYFADGQKMEAEVVGSDPQTEIAVIKVDGKRLPTLPLGDSDELRVGDWIIAIGNPFGLTHTVTAGIVSAQERGDVQISAIRNYIQTDAAINPGNSGGPLLNLDGEVVGLNTALYSRTGGYMGISFSIPINMVKHVKDQLIDTGKFARGFLGVSIQDLTPELASSFGLDKGKGVLIAQVHPDTPAERSGFETGDVVVEFDGGAAERSGSFQSDVSMTTPGTPVRVVLLRDGRRLVKNVVVGEFEESETMVARTRAPEAGVELGITVQNVTDEIAESLGYADESGVVVTDVKVASPAAQQGLRPGTLITEVNRKPVHNTREFAEAMQEAEGDDSVLFLVRGVAQDAQYSRYVAIELD